MELYALAYPTKYHFIEAKVISDTGGMKECV